MVLVTTGSCPEFPYGIVALSNTRVPPNSRIMKLCGRLRSTLEVYSSNSARALGVGRSEPGKVERKLWIPGMTLPWQGLDKPL